MRITTREATHDDIPTLEDLYRSLETEMAGLHPMWPLADGLDEPVSRAFESALDDSDAIVLLGGIDEYPLGFLVARVEEILPQADGQRIGSIRLIYVEQDAREVAVGEAMRDAVMDMLRSRGITRFDAHVLPGHRLAKNFFESGGFAARSIVMHHDDQKK